MYDPKGNSKERAAQSVQFVEAEPPDHLRGIVHRFLDIRTDGTLTDDYRFHALPDACTYIVFDQLNRDIAGVTKLRASSEELNLGRAFHYVNIRFFTRCLARQRRCCCARYGGSSLYRRAAVALPDTG